MTDTALVHGVKSLVLHCLVPGILGQLMPQTWLAVQAEIAFCKSMAKP